MKAIRIPYKPLGALAGLILASAATPAVAGPDLQHALLLGLTKGTFSESYLEQDIQVAPSAIDRFLLSWRGALDGADHYAFRIGRGAYRIDDQDFPGTLHQRSETGLLAGRLRGFEWLGGTLGLGLGYSAQVLQVESSATLPGDDPGFLFLRWQAFHGPAVMQSFQRQLWGPLGISLEAEWLPYVFSSLSDSRLPMPTYTTAIRLSPRLTLWGERVSIGYLYDRTIGSGFNREVGGPFVSVSIAGI